MTRLHACLVTVVVSLFALIIGVVWSSGFKAGQLAVWSRGNAPLKVQLPLPYAYSEGLDKDGRDQMHRLCVRATLDSPGDCLTVYADGAVEIQRDGQDLKKWSSADQVPKGERAWWARRYQLYRLIECKPFPGFIPWRDGRPMPTSQCGWEGV